MKWIRRLTHRLTARPDVDRRPQDSSASLVAGMEKAKEEQWADAAQHFQDAVRFDPLSAEAHHNLSIALLHLNDIEEAFLSALTAVEFTPDSVTLLLNLGSAALRTQRTEQAEYAFKEALALDPDNTSVHSNLGILYCQQKSWDSAIFHLTEADVTTQPNPSVLVPLTAAYRNYGKLSAAETTIDRVLESFPASIEGLMERARIYQAKALWVEAGNTVRKIIALAPDHTESQYLLALSLHNRGQPTDAIETLETYWSLIPTTIRRQCCWLKS